MRSDWEQEVKDQRARQENDRREFRIAVRGQVRRSLSRMSSGVRKMASTAPPQQLWIYGLLEGVLADEIARLNTEIMTGEDAKRS